ncbi:MAG TPA: anhydro-N-acetylmuramic acid kinase, partial [Firmicutes bacterium]|nr:anhydro-N-acetylmuramic acid kinase [Bacillota bacterium]
MVERWEKLCAKSSKKVLGLNSGTSYDGIDAAIVEITGWGKATRVQLLAYHNYAYSTETRRLIAELFDPGTGG